MARWLSKRTELNLTITCTELFLLIHHSSQKFCWVHRGNACSCSILRSEMSNKSSSENSFFEPISLQWSPNFALKCSGCTITLLKLKTWPHKIRATANCGYRFLAFPPASFLNIVPAQALLPPSVASARKFFHIGPAGLIAHPVFLLLELLIGPQHQRSILKLRNWQALRC